MSNIPPGWWQASDGNWYPPQSPQQPQQPIIIQQKGGNGCLIAALIAAVLLLLGGGCAILIAVGADTKEENAAVGTEMLPATAGQKIRLADNGATIEVANGIVDTSPGSPVAPGSKCVTVKAKFVNESDKPTALFILGRNGATAMSAACGLEGAIIQIGPSGTYELKFSFVVPESATEVVFTTQRELIVQGEQVGPFAFFKIAA